MIDSYGRKINYLRVSVTDLCNIRCKYCTPEEGIKKYERDEILTLEEIELLIREFVELGITKVRITGGEPLVRKNVIKLLKNIGEIDRIENLSITTNGILLKEYLRNLEQAGVNGINISIDSLDKERYFEITRGGDLERVLKGLNSAFENGSFKIKINVVLIENFNFDEVRRFILLTQNKNIDVRFIELMPIGEAAKWANDKMISTNEILSQMPELQRIEKSDNDSTAVYFKLPNSLGKVGIISPLSCKFCGGCTRLRLTADGKLKTCLHSNEEIDLKKILRENGNIKQAILDAVKSKPEQHKLDEGFYIKRNMIKIGG